MDLVDGKKWGEYETHPNFTYLLFVIGLGRRSKFIGRTISY